MIAFDYLGEEAYNVYFVRVETICRIVSTIVELNIIQLLTSKIYYKTINLEYTLGVL